jgi:hypothetical protein
MHLQLFEHVVDMVLHGGHFDPEPDSNFLVGQAFVDEP